jgi:hypothetical protein
MCFLGNNFNLFYFTASMFRSLLTGAVEGTPPLKLPPPKQSRPVKRSAESQTKGEAAESVEEPATKKLNMANNTSAINGDEELEISISETTPSHPLQESTSTFTARKTQEFSEELQNSVPAPGLKSSETDTTADLDPKPYKCLKCPKDFNKPHKLQTHL